MPQLTAQLLCGAGHSLGGALASMCAFDLAWSKIGCLGDKQGGDLLPVTAFTFEAPRVGEQSSILHGDIRSQGVKRMPITATVSQAMCPRLCIQYLLLSNAWGCANPSLIA